jgi:type I restriction enzyme S subunit
MVRTRYKLYNEYKPSGIEWLGEVPEHWDVDRLRWSVTCCQNGIWGDVPDGQNDIICVRVADFDRIALRVNIDEPTVRAVMPNDRGSRLLRRGDLLLEKSGGGELQPVGAVVQYDHDVEAVCSNFVARMSVASGFNARFLTYLHAHLYSRRVNVRSIKQTTGIQNLDSMGYLDDRVAIPTLDEQCTIGAFLDRETARIDALIEKKQRQIELLQEKRASLISHAVTKGLPAAAAAQAGLNPNVKMKDSGIEWLGEIPEHWDVRRLKFLFGNLDHRRIPLSAEERSYMEKKYPYYGASGIIDSVENYLFNEPLILVAEDGANLLSRSTPLAFIAEGKYWVNNHAHILKPFTGSLRYWEGVLQTYDYTPLISGSAQPKLTGENLGDIPLPAPPVEEQLAIAVFLDQATYQVESLVAKVHASVEILREYRTALISAAVTGKIDVRQEVA